MLQLTETKIRAGVWEGILTGAGEEEPSIEATHQTRPVQGLKLQRNEAENYWLVSLPIPPEAISEGVQTILLNDTANDHQLGSITLLAGDAMSEDVRAEIDLLRAELDLLKRAFRRHCAETA
ncbi:MAG: hypothetical protein HKN30_15985 [Sulfitobacter sp.]|nr:hypothetical protein [Sulfitobacter sp.]